MHVFREICAISIISKCNRFISKKVMTIKITVLLPIFVPPSLYNRFDTDVYYNKTSFLVQIKFITVD
jgi:hypothetical protein